MSRGGVVTLAFPDGEGVAVTGLRARRGLRLGGWTLRPSGLAFRLAQPRRGRWTAFRPMPHATALEYVAEILARASGANVLIRMPSDA